MAENQTAANEDSGQQQQQNQQQTQQVTNSSQAGGSSPNSVASSPENSQESHSIATSATAPTRRQSHTQQQQQQQNHPHQPQRSSMFDRQLNAKFKPSGAASGATTAPPPRRNSIQTPSRSVVSTTNIKKPPLTKVNSLSNNSGIGAPSITNHHHHTSSHLHHHSNCQNAAALASIQRTTSESLRLNALSKNSGNGGNSSTETTNLTTTTANVSRATSNSSIATVASSTSSVAPKSTSSQVSSGSSASAISTTHSAGSGKATSPNNNGNGGPAVVRNVGGGSAAHHRHHHHNQTHQHHHISHSQGHQTQQQVQQHHGGGGGGGNRKPKTTSSFQITSVTVGHPKLNTAGDTGDESADDLDESHTDDNSRITDLENETPSMSEDTFSKEEVFFANNALSTTAPVIPTSSQYGLVVVDPIGPSLGQTIQNVQVNVSDNIINVVSAAVTPGGTKKKDDIKETQHRSERFKVVKIESTEPFKRGRWMCMDYLDHSSVGNGGGNNNEKTASSESAVASADADAGVAPPKTTQSMILTSNAAAAMLKNYIDDVANSDANWNYTEGTGTTLQQPQQPQLNATPSGVMTAPATVVHGMQQFVNPAASNEQQQLFSDSVNANASPNTGQDTTPHGQTLPIDYATAAAQQLQQSLQQLKQQEEAIAAAANEEVVAGGAAGTSYQQQQSTPQTATLPSRIHFHNGADIAGNNNNNNLPAVAPAAPVPTPTTATTTNEQQMYVEQQQPTSPTPQTQAPTFAAVVATIPTEGQQASHQMAAEQTPKLQQQTSQIDGIVPFQQQTSITSTSTQQQGQTVPLLAHMNSYEPAQSGASATGSVTTTAATTAQQQLLPPTQQLQSAPATISDGQTLVAAVLQHSTMGGVSDVSVAPAISATSLSSVHENQQQQQQNPKANLPGVSANNSNANLTNAPATSGAAVAAAVNAASTNNTTTPLSLSDEQQQSTSTAATSATAALTSASTQQQIQQLQQQPNAESETESLAQAPIMPSSRKRAFSTPHVVPVSIPLASGFSTASQDNFTRMQGAARPIVPDDSRLKQSPYYYDKSNSGRTSFCVDESLWPSVAQRASDTNIYTNLALGDERYKLPQRLDGAADEDYEEAIDQFSPTLYDNANSSHSRAIPIPNSPHRRLAGGERSPNYVAFSASPTAYAHPYSPFLAGSPEVLSPPVGGVPVSGASRLSYSYDPAYGVTINRLQIPPSSHSQSFGSWQQHPHPNPNPRPRTPLECATAMAAAAAAATLNSASGTSAVAIDNKIEQAMDLVKSHLMIAVREEVEVLKERISELMDKINKLELENNILKSNISQETLQQLQMQLQIAATQQPAAVGAPPATPAIQAPPISAATGPPTNAVSATSPAPASAPVAMTASIVGSAVIGESSGGTEASLASSTNGVAAAAPVPQQLAANATASANTNGPMS
ncbi:protein bunched, class 2/F/G isoform isoform X1 [Scaptodrosophila lebanonensis]|uniref:Protein bunched, class 2/F/G isoform isoform X1 n=1 Tax=Drosophila lebanonensis TaxID=7225 RepID=A0A6J2TYB0_DROLE|nr:protein bunched, class 2/F/G isoform isoform X1 [Scaptodrosophila lebanonensis]